MSVTAFTCLVLFIYLVALKFVGYFAYKRSVASSEDYFLAKRKVGVMALVATTCASIFSTGTVVSAPSEFYTEGANYMWIFAFALIPIAMMPVVLKFWKIGKVKQLVTPGQLLHDFYQSKSVSVMTAIIGLLTLIPYAAAQLVAIGKTFEALTDAAVPYEIAVTIVCAALAMYLYFGGSRAVIWTDLVQGIIFSSLLMITGVLVLSWVGVQPKEKLLLGEEELR